MTDMQQQQQTMTTAVFLPSSGVVQLQTVPGYVTMQEPTNPSVVQAYLSKQSKALGITLIIVGVIAFIANGITFANDDYLAPVGHGFWCGTLFILTGAFGVGAASKNRGLIITFMILGIFSSIVTIFLFFIGLGGAFGNRCSYSYSLDKYLCGNQSVQVAMESILCALSVVAGVVSIWGSAICCKAVCCCGPTYGVVLATSYGNQQMFVSQQPATVQYGNQQVISVPMSPPSYQPVPTGYPPTQQQFVVSGPYQSQYGYNAVSAPHPGISSTVDGATAATPPPAYAEFNDEKGFKC